MHQIKTNRYRVNSIENYRRLQSKAEFDCSFARNDIQQNGSLVPIIRINAPHSNQIQTTSKPLHCARSALCVCLLFFHLRFKMNSMFAISRWILPSAFAVAAAAGGGGGVAIINSSTCTS